MKQAITNYALGGAAAVLASWGFSFWVDIPAEVGAALGTFFTWIAWRLDLGAPSDA